MIERVGGWARWIAKHVIDGLIDDRRFQRLIRHIVLSVHAEQEYKRDKQILDTFFELCTEAHVHPRIEKGKLVFDFPEKLDEHLQKVLMLYRPQIREHVERMEDMERREAQREQKKQRPA